MSERSTLARPYAEAVFKRALESKSIKAWSDTLTFLSLVVKDKEMTVIMTNPKVSQSVLIQLFLDICQQQIDQEGQNLVKLLIQNDRLALAPHISTLYETFKAEYEGYVDVEMISAYPLTKEEQKKFASMLGKQWNKEVHITASVDKQLIGGFLARAGDKVIDGSTKGQLQQLAKKL